MRVLVGAALSIAFFVVVVRQFPSIVPNIGRSTVYVGVISSPANIGARRAIREFWKIARTDRNSFHYHFVFGNGYLGAPPDLETQRAVEAERRRQRDVLIVDAREQILNPGKASEKSAAWWKRAPHEHVASFYCKTDDDAMIHPERLQQVLTTIERDVRNEHVMLSYIRWRGWEPHDRFQACGGGWGGPSEAIKDLSIGGNCATAEGPFPQGTGLLTCLSRPLALKLADDDEFSHFTRVAYSRNTFGTPCGSVTECAQQPNATHMWHHEDAGISYNVWRMAVRKRLPVHIVHFPDRGWLFPWLAKLGLLKHRTLLVHKFGAHDFEKLVEAWKPNVPPVASQVDCSQACDHWGWTRARVDCDVSLSKTTMAWRRRDNGSLCEIVPKHYYRCCFVDVERRF